MLTWLRRHPPKMPWIGVVSASLLVAVASTPRRPRKPRAILSTRCLRNSWASSCSVSISISVGFFRRLRNRVFGWPYPDKTPLSRSDQHMRDKEQTSCRCAAHTYSTAAVIRRPSDREVESFNARTFRGLGLGPTLSSGAILVYSAMTPRGFGQQSPHTGWDVTSGGQRTCGVVTSYCAAAMLTMPHTCKTKHKHKHTPAYRKARKYHIFCPFCLRR